MQKFACACVIGLASGVTLAGPLAPPAGPVASTGRFGPRVEINQENTPGDAFSTFVISQPGSYYLAGNVTGEANKRGINIEASGVTVDLMGFEVAGVVDSGIGIRAESGTNNLRIENGTVRDWGSTGINVLLSSNVVLRSLICAGNGGDGLTAARAVVSDCVAQDNGASGIAIGRGAIDRCVSEGNDTTGILIALGTLSNSEASNNMGSGIFADGSTVIGCLAFQNGADGIATGASSVIMSNSVFSNVENGIDLSSNSCVAHNVCWANGTGGVGAGIFVSVGEGNRIEANNLLNNPIGIDIDGTGNLIIRNSARGNGTEFTVVAGNGLGDVIGGNGVIISENPWANIDY